MPNTIVAFGEIMLRLTPPDRALLQDAAAFSACYGGSEANVLIALSALGDRTAYLTALPQNELGDAVIRHLRANGVDTAHIVRQGDTLGMYFLEEGFGARPTKVIYNRRHAEVTRLGEDAFDYDAVFAGCSFFHISGISFALSEQARTLCFRLLKEAKARGVRVSFDFNYRAKLWTTAQAAAVYREVLPYVDVLFCAEKDLTVFLDTDVEGLSRRCPGATVFMREREVLPNGEHTARVTAYAMSADGAQAVRTIETRFSVLERIGGGDAFAAGVLHGLNTQGDIAAALALGVDCFVAKHTVKGDALTLSENAVRGYANDLSRNVSR